MSSARRFNLVRLTDTTLAGVLRQAAATVEASTVAQVEPYVHIVVPTRQDGGWMIEMLLGVEPETPPRAPHGRRA